MARSIPSKKPSVTLETIYLSMLLFARYPSVSQQRSTMMAEAILTAPVDVSVYAKRRRRPERPVSAHLVLQIVTEYADMPGLSLTVSQAARLFDADRRSCEAALRILVVRGHLEHSDDGRYRRASAHRRAWRRAGEGDRLARLESRRGRDQAAGAAGEAWWSRAR
jgi:hypothetical protein